MIRLSITLLMIMVSGMVTAQQSVYREIAALKASGMQPVAATVLGFQTEDVHDRSLQLEGLTQGSILSLEQDQIEMLMRNPSANAFIRIDLPLSERTVLPLVLVRHEILSHDFTLYTSDNPAQPAAYTPGVYYKGIVDGAPTSVVALSVFSNQVMGLISTRQGNAVLGPIKGDRENRHVFYRDQDLATTADFECGTLDDGLGYTEDQLKDVYSGRDAGDCVRLYIEIDDDIVTDKGGATPATNYITGLFNQVIVLYNNESINMSINEILAWTTNSPYTAVPQVQC